MGNRWRCLSTHHIPIYGWRCEICRMERVGEAGVPCGPPLGTTTKKRSGKRHLYQHSQSECSEELIDPTPLFTGILGH